MIEPKNLPRPEDQYPVRRALISVFDKAGLIPFAERLRNHGVAIISTGGTARTLKEAGIPVTEVSSLTSFPEIMNGRVKTLHPAIHAGLLARRNDREDLASLAELQIEPIDLVVVNLYPFSETVARAEATEEVVLENIDIGGPAMIRAAAKNFYFVGVVVSPSDYDRIAEEMEETGGKLTMETRRYLAGRAFQKTAEYDRVITDYFLRSPESDSPTETVFTEQFDLSAPKAQNLRYGENPHQKAALFGKPELFFRQMLGKELSFNNLIDLNAALLLIDEFRDADPTCAILKHTNPCGIATAQTLETAYQNAFATDRQSPYGGIVVVNQSLDIATAEAVDKIFTEIIIAPDFEDGILDFLSQKKNRRILKLLRPARDDHHPDLRSVIGGVLVQEKDPVLASLATLQTTWRVVTERSPTDEEWKDLDFAWRVVKHVKSNAIVFAKNRATIGIGAGQMSRVDSSEFAVIKGKKSELDFSSSVVASDAFFPFADGLEATAQVGARAVIQPGGSVRDQEVIDAANRHNMAMVFTGKRHFRH